jgi:hypothetical protein
MEYEIAPKYIDFSLIVSQTNVVPVPEKPLMNSTKGGVMWVFCTTAEIMKRSRHWLEPGSSNFAAIIQTSSYPRFDPKHPQKDECSTVPGELSMGNAGPAWMFPDAGKIRGQGGVFLRILPQIEMPE